MNGSYYQNPTFPAANSTMPEVGAPMTGVSLPMEQSYIENILRLNKGKKVRIHASYPDSNEWRDRVFSGIIEEAGRDHVILSDPASGRWYLIIMIYINFVEFEEKINYSHGFSEKTF